MGRSLDPEQILKRNPLCYVDQESNDENHQQILELVNELHRQLQSLTQILTQMTSSIRTSIQAMNGFSQVFQQSNRAVENRLRQHQIFMQAQRDRFNGLTLRDLLDQCKQEKKQNNEEGYFSRFSNFCKTKIISFIDLVALST